MLLHTGINNSHFNQRNKHIVCSDYFNTFAMINL